MKDGLTVGPNGDKQWRLNGKLHRVDGPSFEWPDGTKQWHLNGKLHRVDGPAIEWADGTKNWYLNGRRHRIDGPAIERENKEWHLNDKELPEDLFIKLTGDIKELPLYLGKGFDEFIAGRLKDEGRINCRT